MADNLSLRDQLQASYDELSTDETPAAVGESAPNQAPAAEAGEAAAVQPQADASTPKPADPLAQAAADEGRPRGPDGKFLPKDPAAEGATAQPPAQAQSETATPADAGPQPSGTTSIPPSLPAAIKAKFATLDPDVQQAFVALEGTVQTAKAEWTAKGQRLNRFDEIIGPSLPRWQMAGLDEYSGIQSLIAAQALLDRDPVSGIQQIARSYNLTPAHLAQAFGVSQTSGQQPGTEGQYAPTNSPDLQAALQQVLNPVLTQVQTIQQRLDQTAQQSEAASLADAQQAIDAFAAKPENMYFHNVQDAVADIITADAQAKGPLSRLPLGDRLKEAYDRAIWADPTIRPHLIKAQADASAAEVSRKAEETRKAAEEAARNKARTASHAGGSVTGSPTPGSAPPKAAYGSVREAALAAIEELSGA